MFKDNIIAINEIINERKVSSKTLASTSLELNPSDELNTIKSLLEYH